MKALDGQPEGNLTWTHGGRDWVGWFIWASRSRKVPTAEWPNHTQCHAHTHTVAPVALYKVPHQTQIQVGTQRRERKGAGEGHHLPFPFAPQVLKGNFVISRHVCACERASSCVCVCACVSKCV